MAMTPSTWSISKLAVEFRLDRRTVARRLDGIAPAGTERGADVWRLADVAPALVGGRAEAMVDGQPLSDLLNGLSLRICAMTAPAVFAGEAVKAGLSVEMAWRLFQASRGAMLRHASTVAEDWTGGTSPFEGENLADLEAGFTPPDWKVLAAHSGAVVDLDAWAERLDQPLTAKIAMGAAK